MAYYACPSVAHSVLYPLKKKKNRVKIEYYIVITDL